MQNIEILTPLSGNPEHFRNWNEALMNLEVEDPVSLKILDNSNRDSFNDLLNENRKSWKEKFREVNVIRFMEPYVMETPENSLESGRHYHVAKLYSRLFSELKSDLVLTFEEDIIPKPDALKKLLQNFNIMSVGVIGSAYSSPQNKDMVCAAFGNKRWSHSIPWRLLNGALVSLDYIGGGFTLWNLSKLENKEISIDWDRLLGWDAILCEQIKASGLKVLLAGNVICGHNNRFIM